MASLTGSCIGRSAAPGPVRAGGLILLSFTPHAIGGAEEYSQEQQAHGGTPVTVMEYLGTSRFWFESFQNSQSEFLAVASIVVLSIFLRQRGSPESKPVHEPHRTTGTA